MNIDGFNSTRHISSHSIFILPFFISSNILNPYSAMYVYTEYILIA